MMGFAPAQPILRASIPSQCSGKLAVHTKGSSDPNDFIEETVGQHQQLIHEQHSQAPQVSEEWSLVRIATTAHTRAQNDTAGNLKSAKRNSGRLRSRSALRMVLRFARLAIASNLASGQSAIWNILAVSLLSIAFIQAPFFYLLYSLRLGATVDIVLSVGPSRICLLRAAPPRSHGRGPVCLETHRPPLRMGARLNSRTPDSIRHDPPVTSHPCGYGYMLFASA